MGLYTSHHFGTNVWRELFRAFVSVYLRPRVSGVENLPSSGAWILASNHSSHADTAVIFTAIPRRMTTRLVAVAAHDYFFSGGLRQMAARILFNAIPVERESPGRHDPLRYVVRALREDYGVLIYPEGTRSRNGKIGPFRAGIGRLIAQFPGVPVIPTLLEETSEVMPKGHAIPRPHRVRVTFGAPLVLEASMAQRASWQTAANEVRAAIISMQNTSMQNTDDAK